MVTGTLPFEGDTAVSIAIKHIQERVKPPGEINPKIYKSLQAVIQKAISKLPEERYQNAGEMIKDLRRALEEPNGDFVVTNYNSDAPTQVLKPINIEANREADDALSEDEDIKNPKKRPWIRAVVMIFIFTFIMGLANLRMQR